jgi:acylphosphatase
MTTTTDGLFRAKENAMATKTIRAIVTGRVQGVFFRAYTEEEALRCGVNGWVRNLPDRSVEVLASGEADRVDRLVAWLSIGPPLAQVSRVQVEELEKPDETLRGFEIRY